MKHFFLFIALTAALSTRAQTNVIIQWAPIKPGNSGDTIYYDPSRRLTWNDFRGRPDGASPAAAITESGFGYRMSMQSYKQRATIIITVFCYFNKKGSWVKRNMDTDYALLHEQHHYDITWINANRFVQKLKDAKFTLKNYDSLVEQIHDECFAALDKMQNEYDGETSNGRIPRNQYKWNKKIDEHLEDLMTTSSR
jgi:hypothetical protein